MDDLLMDHAISFWEERGIDINKLDDFGLGEGETRDIMYKAWAIWAFNKLRGD